MELGVIEWRMVHIASEGPIFVSSDHLHSVMILRKLGREGGEQILVDA